MRTIAELVRHPAAQARGLSHDRGRRRGVGVGKGPVLAQSGRRLHPTDPAGHPPDARMVSATRTMEFVVTGSEAEALLLENNLIKLLRPRFNVLLRDDKSFPTSSSGATPNGRSSPNTAARASRTTSISAVRPATAVNRTLYAPQRAFPLRSCSDGVFSTRTRPLPAVPDQGCTAPCVGRIDRTEYGRSSTRCAISWAGGTARSSKPCRSAWTRPRRVWEFETRGRACATYPRPGAHPVAPVDQPAFDRRGGHLRRPRRGRGRSASRCSSRAPARTSAIAPISPPTPSDPTSRPSCRPSSASSTRAPGAAPDPDQPRRRRGRPAGKRLAMTAGPPRWRSATRSAARRRTRSTRRCPTPARHWRGAWPSAARSASCSMAWRAFGLDGPPERIEVYDNSHIQGTPDRRHGRRRPGRFHQEFISKVQHQERGRGRRRFRHDARGAVAALRPGAARGSRAQRGALARLGADRWRPGQLGGRRAAC